MKVCTICHALFEVPIGDVEPEPDGPGALAPAGGGARPDRFCSKGCRRYAVHRRR